MNSISPHLSPLRLKRYNLCGTTCFYKEQIIDLKAGEEAVEERVKVHPAFDNVWSSGKLSLYEPAPKQLHRNIKFIRSEQDHQKRNLSAE